MNAIQSQTLKINKTLSPQEIEAQIEARTGQTPIRWAIVEVQEDCYVVEAATSLSVIKLV